MLQALENGVKGDKWFSLIDKVWKLENFSAAWMKAWANGGSAGVDGQSLGQFTGSLSQELEGLHAAMQQPQQGGVNDCEGAVAAAPQPWPPTTAIVRGYLEAITACFRRATTFLERRMR